MDLVRPFSGRTHVVFPKSPPFLATFAGSRLGVVAANHSIDRDDPLFGIIRDAFDVIRPDVVIIEGVETRRGENPQSIAERATSGRVPEAAGEALFTAGLALTSGSRFIGGEPSDAEVFDDLLASGFPATDAFYAFLFGPLDQEVREDRLTGPADPRFDPVFERWTAMIARRIPNAPTTSADAFRRWYRERFGKGLNDDPDWLRSNDPARPGPMQAVVIAHTLARDRHLFRLIADRMGSGDRTLVVFGASHVANIWPALAATFGRPLVNGVRPTGQVQASAFAR